MARWSFLGWFKCERTRIEETARERRKRRFYRPTIRVLEDRLGPDAIMLGTLLANGMPSVTDRVENGAKPSAALVRHAWAGDGATAGLSVSGRPLHAPAAAASKGRSEAAANKGDKADEATSPPLRAFSLQSPFDANLFAALDSAFPTEAMAGPAVDPGAGVAPAPPDVYDALSGDGALADGLTVQDDGSSSTFGAVPAAPSPIMPGNIAPQTLSPFPKCLSL
jgi:hypothetical protein